MNTFERIKRGRKRAMRMAADPEYKAEQTDKLKLWLWVIGGMIVLAILF